MADVARSRPAPDVLGQAVREGIMQRLAAAAAQGDAGDALTGGGSGQSSAIEQFTGTRAAAAGVIPFSDALLETGSTLPSSRIAPPVGQPAWGRAVGEQVVWFVGQNIHSASLKLNPQHLGPLELQLHVDGDKASIAFASQHAVVRDALESSLARLRDLLAEQGLNLVNVNISQQDAGGRRDHAAAGERNGATLHASGTDEILLPAAGVTATGAARGLVDYYV
jgi:flagellar hook-length control protein FliK